MRNVLRQDARALALAGLLASGTSCASATTTASGVLTVQASVVATCTVASGTLAFGVINPAVGTTSLPSTNLSVTCTLGTPFSVGLGDGANASGGQRRMKGATQLQYLSYDLFRDAMGTQRFGDSVTSQRLASQTGLGVTANALPVYGAVSSGQSAAADTYSDTVPITVYY